MYVYAPKLYRDYLTTRLDGVRVAGKVPADRPARLVTVRMAPAGSSPKPRVLAWRRLVFQCWAPGELETGRLCEQVRDEVVESVYAHIGARKVRVVGEPASFPDPDDDSPRFQTTIDVMLRANH